MRKLKTTDAGGALKYPSLLCQKDPIMVVTYTVDERERLQYLFWCDAESQMNYKVFGVNHHNHTIVFAAAVVTNETEETYVWLFEKFLQAMNGKAPFSVIADGDVAMKNSIKRVFLNAHHRLSVGHLMRNATSHVRDKGVLKCLKSFMLSDIEVVEFEERWTNMVGKYELQDNHWITDLYARRKTWSPTHIRGNFFAGIQTTSRCEAFHSHVAKYVDSLEKSVGTILTKEMLLLLKPTIAKTVRFKVVDCKEMTMFSIYTVVKYRSESIWCVCYWQMSNDFICSCFRMESIGLPCDHIVSVLLCLNITNFPNSLLTDRWSKNAKEPIKGKYLGASLYWESEDIARYATLLQLSREVCEAGYRVEEDFDDLVVLFSNEVTRLKSKNINAGVQNEMETHVETVNEFDGVLNPPVVRAKGCGQTMNNESNSRRRIQTCGICGATGHNRRKCTVLSQNSIDAGGRGMQLGNSFNRDDVEKD
ncbi:hypothetical protein JHK82_034062 [Glycine max]|nr:hypothetical protein JHK82_034062 [Glycine max]